jgi:metal-responsive CopG/Arc/MetJ family transcriptional regulator
MHRVNVNFSAQAYRTLQHLSERSGNSMSEVLRQAIALEVWVEQERAKGSRILVESPGGSIRELLSVSA